MVKEVYRVTGIGEVSKDFALKDQIRRTAISVVFNISEGFARKSNKEFRQFLYRAHGSIAEVQSALYIARDLNYIEEKEFKHLYKKADEISRMIAGFIKYLGAKPNSLNSINS